MNRIKELRKLNKISQKDLVSNLGITQQALSNYEKEKRIPDQPTWQALADFFNVSVPYLKGYMVCSRCQGYFIPENNIIRENIKCCPYCMNPYFEGDKNEMEND